METDDKLGIMDLGRAPDGNTGKIADFGEWHDKTIVAKIYVGYIPRWYPVTSLRRV